VIFQIIIMRKIFIVIFFLTTVYLKTAAQELYVYAEPASNMPAHSISGKLTGNFIARNQNEEQRMMQRYTPEILLGITKKLMVHVGSSFADMHSRNFRWESAYTYAKYRFVSVDDVHKHFRMAAFGDFSYSRSPFHYDELSLQGDQSGGQVGIIATQLWNKLAVSGTTSVLHVFETVAAHHSAADPMKNAANYSLSVGYLLFPLNYTSYRQVNLNLYLEMLGQSSLDKKSSYIDMAPALQLIFNSVSKINMGYRFQVNGNMYRMSKESWLLSFEWVFLNALKKRN
jgi:hypothetical protein